jgi:hypothetical protein
MYVSGQELDEEARKTAKDKKDGVVSTSLPPDLIRELKAKNAKKRAALAKGKAR